MKQRIRWLSFVLLFNCSPHVDFRLPDCFLAFLFRLSLNKNDCRWEGYGFDTSMVILRMIQVSVLASFDLIDLLFSLFILRYRTFGQRITSYLQSFG